MPITGLDGIVLGITLFSAVLAMVRGFSREVLSVVSWAGSAYAAYKLYPVGLPYAQNFVSDEKIAMVASAAGVFLIALIVISFITMKIADFIIDSRIGALDRTLGFLFGAGRGVLIIVVAVAFFNEWVPDPAKQPGWIAEAKSKPFLDNLGGKLKAALPEDVAELLKKKIEEKMGKKDEGQATEGETTDAPADNPVEAPADTQGTTTDGTAADAPAEDGTTDTNGQ